MEDIITAKTPANPDNYPGFVTMEIHNLNHSTKYYFRPYAKLEFNEKDHYYFGQSKSFTTKSHGIPELMNNYLMDTIDNKVLLH